MATYGSTITNFATAPQSEIDIGGVGYNVQDAGKSYSLEELDSTTTRFEIQGGDQASFDAGSAVDRSELSGSLYVPAGTPVTLNYQWMMEPGQTNAASWMVVGEVHNLDTSLANSSWQLSANCLSTHRQGPASGRRALCADRCRSQRQRRQRHRDGVVDQSHSDHARPV
jgi:hypothetical protein